MKIGFLGAGNIATALLSGILREGIFSPGDISVYDVLPEKADAFCKRGVLASSSPEELVKGSDAIILAVKPQNFTELLPCIHAVSSGKLFISVAAGISINYIRAGLGEIPVVRVMPNLPMVYSCGVTVLCKSEDVSDAQFELAKSIFSACGKIGVIDESLMNAMIAVHSSSPAFMFLFAKAVGDYAGAWGIDRDEAISLFAHAMLGSAKMLIDSGNTCDELINMVASPGGTTRAALNKFEELNFCDTIIKAMNACTARAIDLGAK